MADRRDAELGEDECWELLRGHELGRLAFRVGDDQHLTPINYAVDADTRRLLFRTARIATKLLSAELGGQVAFEIDELDGEVATSVVVRGYLRHLDDEEARRAESLPLRPWVGPDKPDVVEIVPEEVTGRRFDLHRPWLRMRP